MSTANTTRADKAAADRLLTAAVRRAVTMTRPNPGLRRDEVEALLTAAGTAADVLLAGADS